MKETREGRQQVLIDYAFTHSFDESVQLILEKTAAEVGSPKGMLTVLEEEEGTIHVVATVGELAQAMGSADDSLPVSFPGTADGNDWFTCFAGTKTIVHGETCRSPEWPFFGSEHATASTALYIPFMTPVRARAAFAFFGRSEPFTEEDRYVVEQISFLPLRIAFEERRLFALLEIRTIYDSVADVLFTLAVESDEIFRFTSVNRRFLEITGLSRDAVVGKDFREVIPPESQELVLSKYREAVDERRSVSWEETSEYAAGLRYGEVSVKPIFDSHGRCTHLIGTVHDVTVQRQSEQEREGLRDELEQARKMESVGRLAGGVAHDFNNQLTVIIGHAELMLARMGRGEPNREDLLAIKTAAMRSADLTRQLLAFARRQSISPRLLDLNKAVDGMIRMLRRLIGENIELVWRPGRTIGAVKLDPVQIDQILANLCLNARDAIKSSGRIIITTEQAHLDSEGNEGSAGGAAVEHVLLSVTDNGSGMDAETLSRIFEPFFTTKATGKGTGLGAATVYGIVQQNRGRIKVESEVGSGTSFRLYFPAHHETVDESRPRTRTLSTLGLGETILLVEDDRSILDSTSRVLESIGYKVVGITKPEEAIRYVKGHPEEPDVIITDVIMPGMNGKELVDRLTAIRPGLKSLYVSGYTADVIGVQGVLDGDVNFLEKPYRFDDLAAKVREILTS